MKTYLDLHKTKNNGVHFVNILKMTLNFFTDRKMFLIYTIRNMQIQTLPNVILT